ncbi:major capsid protein [Capybara microvirus Cap3_SP_394]|nr:major capsid protein [Capybara microvirus Cap3_SP_394]
MADFFKKLHIKSAVKSHSKFDLSCTHLTTTNFGELTPIYCAEVIPGDKFHVSANCFSRLAPLALPTYGQANIKVASFFVPYHQVVSGFDSWLVGQKQYRGRTLVQPYITLQDLLDFANTHSQSDANNYPVISVLYDNTSHTLYARDEYRHYFRTLNALGYQMPQGVDLADNSTWTTKSSKIKLNALPILCAAKAVNDWLMPSNRINSSRLSTVLEQIFRGDVISGVYAADGHLQNLGQMIADISSSVLYDNNYYTSAWATPFSQLHVDQQNGYIPTTVTQVDYIQQTPSSGTFYGSTVSNSSIRINFLQRLDKWIRRNNFSGQKEIEQILSRFGVKVEDYQSRYSQRLGYGTIPIQIGDVTSTAATSDAVLGDYVGKGIASGGFNFDFSGQKDYGMIIAFAWIQPKAMYTTGYDRLLLKSSPTDYYTPEYDTLQASAIPIMEVAQQPIDAITSDYRDLSRTYGWTQLYNDYRFGKDRITGDFALDQSMHAWHFGRDFSEQMLRGVFEAQNLNIIGDSDMQQYNRIFNVIDMSADHFYLHWSFNVSAQRPICSISEAADLGDGDLIVDRNGTQMNS